MLAQADLEDILEQCSDDFRQLSGAHLLLTGGTGFVGKWMLASVLHANARMHLGARASVVTRDPDGFALHYPELAQHECVSLVRADVRELKSPLPRFDVVVHAATPTDASIAKTQPNELVSVALDGARRILEIAARSGAIPFLFTSSGAVYGKQPVTVARVSEECRTAPDTTRASNAYHETKRMVEMLCAVEAQVSGVQAKIARLFAFAGPFLPLDAHFAVGNFVRDAVCKRPIRILSDGSTVRSYLYASDMAAWLWKILVRGETLRPYNVGSSEAVCLRELASLVQELENPGGTVDVLGAPVPEDAIDIYVPETMRITTELGAEQRVPLREAIRRFAVYARLVLNGRERHEAAR